MTGEFLSIVILATSMLDYFIMCVVPAHIVSLFAY